MKIGILGSGDVARALARGLVALGHSVQLGTRRPHQLAGFVAELQGASVAGPAEAAAFGDIAVLAVKGTAAAELLASVAAPLAGKVVIDTTNPIADAPPVDGVLQFFTGPNDSLMEQLQKAQPALRLVKAFNSVGHACMAQPRFAGGRPTMFIAGDDPAAKALVAGLVEALGWEVADMGSAVAARAIEPLCQLWCIPGFHRNDWVHAFKLLQ